MEKKQKLFMHIVGNRPQFIKLAPLSKELHRRGYKDIIIHSGQHYDANMSDVFFEGLGIDKPVENLAVGSGTHAEITAKVMVGVEKVVEKYKPDVVILYGDTDTTVAAALACAKLNVPIAHVEGGVRTYSKTNPEEKNRVVTDHLSEVVFCPYMEALECAKKEGLTETAYFTGDIMYDTFLQTKEKCKDEVLEKYGLEKEQYVLMTWHRQENTDSKERMDKILDFLSRIPCKIVYPIHPRTKKMLQVYELFDKAESIANLLIIEPVGYDEMVSLQCNSRVILTDSGGLSKESVFAGARCLFMLDLTIWPDLERIGWLQHVDFEDEASIVKALHVVEEGKADQVEVDFYGDGHAAEKMVDRLNEICV